MQSSAPLRVLGLFFIGFSFLALSGSNCGPQVIDEPDSGPDNEQQTCESVEECPDPANYDCLGVCLQRCSADAVCKLDEFCSARGYCEPGCRDSSVCPDGEVCVGGACLDADNVGSCGSKCDCAPGQVCSGGICQDPPAQCGGPDDCGRGPEDRCEAYACNGFTQQCFDPDPQPCAGDNDCAGRPECTGANGCVCNGSSQCVPAGECTVDNEDSVCGPGFFCDDTVGTPTCDVLPACTQESDCTAFSLTCDPGTGQCKRPQPCTGDADCTVAPQTYCNQQVTPAACEVPTCLNGGVTCMNGQVCANDGRCVAEGTGVTCNSDADCPNDAWPDTQFCSFATGAGECTPGCRSNASCTGGDTCNGARQCVSGGGTGGTGQAGDTCDEPLSDPDCQAGLTCTLLGTCEELCTPPATGTCADDPACCPQTGFPNCEQQLLVAFCKP